MSFKASLRQGQIGETLFLDAHFEELTQEDGRKRDFTEIATGQGVELKTDYYPMDKTPNFFFERYSDMEKQSPGGPWQALSHGNTQFIYFFVSGLTYFKFDVKALVKYLDKHIEKATKREIKNKTWTTLGFLIPREDVSHLYEEVKLTVSVKND